MSTLPPRPGRPAGVRSFHWLATLWAALLAWSCAAPVYEGDDPGECSDGADNDLDGAYDCGDSDCFNAPVCQEDLYPTEASLFDDLLQGDEQLDSLCARLSAGNVQSVVRDTFCGNSRPQVTNSQQFLEALGLAL